MEFLRRLIISTLCAAVGAAIYWWSANQGINVSIGALFGLLLAVALSALVIDAMIRGSVSNAYEHASSPRAPQPKTKTSSGSGASSSGDREQGSVKWFNTNKGYGFIARDSGGEIFVHYRSIQGTGRRFLRDGQRVEFTVGEGDKGPQAEDVGVL
ncbi:MAG: cold-shock protein [Pseudomonadales bacterium]